MNIFELDRTKRIKFNTGRIYKYNMSKKKILILKFAKKITRLQRY